MKSSSSSLQTASFLTGSQPLWKAFWGLYVIGGLTFTAIAVLLIKAVSKSYFLLEVSHVINLKAEQTLVMLVAVIVMIGVGFSLFCFLSVWRCSKNTVRKYWAFLAKSVISMQLTWIFWKGYVAFGSLVTYFSH